VKPVTQLKLVVSDDVEYSFKYADRNHLQQLFAFRGDCDDVLIIKKGFVTDCSYANVIFKQNNQWVTPATPLLKGVMRQRLLQTGIIKEAAIHVDEIARFESCKLINALLELNGPEIDVDHIVY
jgi:4-amino-4-deoxychorismate lyase